MKRLFALFAYLRAPFSHRRWYGLTANELRKLIR